VVNKIELSSTRNLVSQVAGLPAFVYTRRPIGAVGNNSRHADSLSGRPDRGLTVDSVASFIVLMAWPFEDSISSGSRIYSRTGRSVSRQRCAEVRVVPYSGVAGQPAESHPILRKPREFKRPVVDRQAGSRQQYSLTTGLRPALQTRQVDDDRSGSAGDDPANRSGKAIGGLAAEIAGQGQNAGTRRGQILPLDCHAAVGFAATTSLRVAGRM